MKRVICASLTFHVQPTRTTEQAKRAWATPGPTTRTFLQRGKVVQRKVPRAVGTSLSYQSHQRDRTGQQPVTIRATRRSAPDARNRRHKTSPPLENPSTVAVGQTVFR